MRKCARANSGQRLKSCAASLVIASFVLPLLFACKQLGSPYTQLRTKESRVERESPAFLLELQLHNCQHPILNQLNQVL